MDLGGTASVGLLALVPRVDLLEGARASTLCFPLPFLLSFPLAVSVSAVSATRGGGGRIDGSPGFASISFSQHS